MKQFLKDNFVLAIGITLPLILIFLFFIAGTLNRKIVTDPQFDAVLAVGYYENQTNNPYDISVDNGNIIIKINEERLKDNPGYAKPRLYIYDHKAQRSRQLDIDLDDTINGYVKSPALTALNQNNITPGPSSPDGYEYDYRYRSGGIFGEFFGFGYRNRNNHVLHKDGRSIPIAGMGRNYRATLVGWVQE